MSELDGETLLRWLSEFEWRDIVAMPVQQKRSVLLDVVFSTLQGQIAISGKAHELLDGSEAFSLDIYSYRPEGWWKKENNSTDWVPRQIGNELTASPLRALMTPPRSFRLFSNPRLATHAHPIDSFLDYCSAIEFSKVVDSTPLKLLVAASTAYPCALEFATDCETCESLLAGLKELGQG